MNEEQRYYEELERIAIKTYGKQCENKMIFIGKEQEDLK